MKYIPASDTYVVTPEDLRHHVECGHLTNSNKEAAPGRLVVPDQRHRPHREALQQRRIQRADDFVAHLVDSGHKVTDLSRTGRHTADATRIKQTRAAMARGDEYIRSGTLQRTSLSGNRKLLWQGRPDLLIRVGGAAETGFRYEAASMLPYPKMAGQAVIAAATHSWLLGAYQISSPQSMHVITSDGRTHTEPVTRFADYHHATLEDFESALTESRSTSPEHNDHCSSCDWLTVCEPVYWKFTDDVRRQTGIGHSSGEALILQNLGTVPKLAAADLRHNYPGLARAEMRRLKVEAQLTIAERQRRLAGDVEVAYPHQLIKPSKRGQGISGQPEPTSQDLFLSITTGATPEGKLAFMWAVGWRDAQGGHQTYSVSVTNEREELQAYKRFMSLAGNRFTENPSMHIYSFADNARATLRSLASKHVSFESEVRELDKAGAFVDQYLIVHRALRLPGGNDDLHHLEQLWSKRLEVPAYRPTVGRDMQTFFDLGQMSARNSAAATARDNVVASMRLNGFLEDKYQQYEQKWGLERPLPSGLPIEPKRKDWQVRIAAEKATREAETAPLRSRFRAELMAGLPANTDIYTDVENALSITGQSLVWHRDERSPEARDYYERLRMTAGELVDDNASIGGLRLIEEDEPAKVRSSVIYHYRFGRQVVTMRVGDTVVDPATVSSAGRIESIEFNPRGGGIIGLARTPGKGDDQPLDPAKLEAIVPSGAIDTEKLNSALMEFAASVVATGIDDMSTFPTARNFLLRNPPQIAGIEPGTPLIKSDASIEAPSLVKNLGVGQVLVFDGLPGTGKTYQMAQAIRAAVADNQQVALPGVSHEGINKILQEVLRQEEEAPILGRPLRILQKATAAQGTAHNDVKLFDNNKKAIAALESKEVDIVAGTSWLWADKGLWGKTQLTVIDEFGQMSVPNALVIAMASTRIATWGDRRQTAPVIRGVHQANTHQSAQQHWFDSKRPAEVMGVSLLETRRMAPGLAEPLSHFYGNAPITSHPSAQQKRILGDPGDPWIGSGVRVVIVDTVGDSQSSRTETAVALKLFAKLSKMNATLNGTDSIQLGYDNILGLSRYNQQVSQLNTAFGQKLRTSTVDSAQGDQALVTFYSMTTSSIENSPRGHSFPIDTGALVTAISRSEIMTTIFVSRELLMAREPSSIVTQSELSALWYLVHYAEAQGHLFNEDLEPIDRIKVELHTAMPPAAEAPVLVSLGI